MHCCIRTVETDKKGMPKTAGAINGVMMKRQVPNEAPILVINVSSVDGYLKKIGKSGGKAISEKINVGDMGFYVRFKDTEGNTIGIWEDLQRN